MLSRLKEIIKDMGELSSQPMAASCILRLIDQTNSSRRELVRAVVRDPDIANRVLKMANSVFYRQNTPATTVERALLLIGENTLRDLVLETCFKSISKSRYQKNFLREDSIGCALASRIVAQNFRSARPEDAFLAGMVRHIGKMVMFKFDPEMYRRVEQVCQDGDEAVLDVELRLFAYSHDMVGSVLLDYWQFSPLYVETTLHHHDFINEIDLDESVYSMAATISLAEDMCRFLGIGCKNPRRELELITRPGAIVLSASEGKIDQTLKRIEEEWRRKGGRL